MRNGGERARHMHIPKAAGCSSLLHTFASRNIPSCPLLTSKLRTNSAEYLPLAPCILLSVSWHMRQRHIHILRHRCLLRSTWTRYAQYITRQHQMSNRTYRPWQEVKLATNNTERELFESLAELYSIIITLDAIEKAYLKDSISEAEYAETCSRLLKQYKSHLQDETVAQNFGDLETFMRKWGVSSAKCHACYLCLNL